jgi:ubiquitin C-terminal hydrolase
MTVAPTRSVARPVANLGNTCYMNAVLQALAHAPELCLAMDCASHRETCPIAAENDAKRRRNSRSSSPDCDEGTAAAAAIQNKTTGTRKSRRAGRKSPPFDTASLNSNSDSYEFCALCEVENHIRHVHEISKEDSKKDKPVAPTTFVHGFIDNVAPEFQLGVQEDSHEFLRLLIDAMQKSCQKARNQDNPQESPTSISFENEEEEDDQDKEYPFSLFRGTVESNVVCEFCKHSSSTLDPIEDVGLEVTVPSAGSSAPLSDVQTAFQRFARAEALDSNYKCEKCGKLGKATKQSRLAKIPPILTLHLKRFRYGDRIVPSAPVPSRRSCRSEVSQLLGSTDFLSGKSGSAKIEGHIKFDLFFDLKPYLTEELKQKQVSTFCRLFAVIVHAGKNSHSGHYIAYVRNISKNEWWKMDDGRVALVTEQEVKQAEAYMLFYRVVQHPVALRLEALAKKKIIQESNESNAMRNSENPNNKLSTSENLSSAENARKRKLESYESGERWIQEENLPSDIFEKPIQKFTALIADNIDFSPLYFKLLREEAAHSSEVDLSSLINQLSGKFAASEEKTEAYRDFKTFLLSNLACVSSVPN